MFFLESIRRDKATKKHFFFFVYWYFGWASKEMEKNYAPSNIWMVEQPQLKDILINQSQYMQNIRKREMHFPTQSIEYNFGPKKSFFPVSFAFPARITTTTANTSIIVCFFFQWNKIRFYSLNECGIFCFIVPSGFAFWLYSVVGLFSVCCKPSRSCNVSEEFVYYYVCVFWVSRSTGNSLGLTHIGQAPEKDQTYNAQAHAYEWRSNKMDRHTDKCEYRKRRYDQAVIKVSVAQIKLYYLKMRKECKGSCIQLVLVLWSSKSFFRLFREFGWINGCSAEESPTKCRFWGMETTLSDKAIKVIALHMARFIQISSENCVFGSKRVRIH